MQNITIYTNALNTTKIFCNCNRDTTLTILLHANFNTFDAAEHVFKCLFNFILIIEKFEQIYYESRTYYAFIF